MFEFSSYISGAKTSFKFLPTLNPVLSSISIFILSMTIGDSVLLNIIIWFFLRYGAMRKIAPATGSSPGFKFESTGVLTAITTTSDFSIYL